MFLVTVCYRNENLCVSSVLITGKAIILPFYIFKDTLILQGNEMRWDGSFNYDYDGKKYVILWVAVMKNDLK